MEKPRPSPNFGKCTSTREAPARRSANAAGSSVGSRRRTSGEGGLSATSCRPLMSAAIDLFLEGLDADAVHDVDETLGVAVAALEIAIDQPFHAVGYRGAREGGAEHLARGGFPPRTSLALVPADLHLVP